MPKLGMHGAVPLLTFSQDTQKEMRCITAELTGKETEMPLGFQI
jgi:hypothetical protein